MTKGYIYTVAGNGNPGYSGDGGPALLAELNSPNGIAVDSLGDLLIADTANSVIRLVANSNCNSNCPYGLTSMTEGYIYTVVGNGTEGYNGDTNPAVSSELYFPDALSVDSIGDLIISDTNNNRIRLVANSNCNSNCPYGLASMTKGYIYTVAGNGMAGYNGDNGMGALAELNFPKGIFVDTSGNILVADSNNNRIRLVANSNCSSNCPYGLTSMIKGYIYTVAGNGNSGDSGDGGPSVLSELSTPLGVSINSMGNIFIADSGNLRIRELLYPGSPTVISVSPNSGTIQGGTTVTLSGSNFYAASAVDFGSVPAITYTVVSDTEITVVSPTASSNIGTVDITVTTSAGTSATSTNDQFTYTNDTYVPITHCEYVIQDLLEQA